MIRPYDPCDKEQVLELWHAFDEIHVTADPSKFQLPSRERMCVRHEKYTTASPEGEKVAPYFMFVAAEKEKINGFICGMLREAPDAALLRSYRFVELHAVYVRKYCRSGIVSRQLVRTALDYAKTCGAQKAICHIWNFNSAAQKHIASLGFTAVSSKYEKDI